MANGRPPSCNSCRHFRLELLPGEQSALIIRRVAGRCACGLHKVLLPFHSTNLILICADWIDRANGETITQWGTAAQRRYAAGILYGYPSEYDATTSEVAKICELPSSLSG
jgi:hypothetical protein